MSEASPVLSAPAEPADITRPLERLAAGEPFVELRHDSVATRAATLDTLLAHLPDTKLVWICNPLRSPLTIERLFLQAAGPEADLRIERTPAELVAMLRSATESAPRTLMIVQQPETLDPEARDTLACLAPLLGPSIQFLFCGTQTFRSIAPHHPAPERAPSLAPSFALAAIDEDSIPRPHAPTRDKLPLLLLLAIALLGGLFVSPIGSEAPVKMTAIPQPDALLPTASAAVATQPQPPPQPEPQSSQAQATQAQPAPAAINVAALRREFDEFLTRQPSRARLTQEQRDALFDEFLTRQQSRRTELKP